MCVSPPSHRPSCRRRACGSCGCSCCLCGPSPGHARVRPRAAVPARTGAHAADESPTLAPGNACLHGPALALRLRLESHWSVCGEKARSGHSSQERRHRHSGQLEPRAAPWLEAGSRTRPISGSFLKSPVLVKMVALNRQHLQLPQVPTESLNHRIVRRTRDRPPSI